MSSGFELINEKNQLERELSASIKSLAKYGREFAQAEADYKICLAETALRLKSEGMAVTMIQMVVYGTADVPKLRFKRDTAEVMYKSAQESIQSTKLKLRLIEAQIEREWTQTNRSV